MTNQDSGFTGSEVSYPAVPANNAAPSSMVPAQLATSVAMPPMGVGGVLPHGPEILHSSFDPTWFINCLRRKWLSALLLGLLAAVVTAGVLLWLIPPSSKVVAYLEVKAEQPETLFGKQRQSAKADPEVFQQTQLALFKSPLVLKSVLARKDITQLEAVIKHEPNARLWLSEEIKIGFIGGGEILQISYNGEESTADMIKIVDAVIDAYKKEVLYTERALSSKTRDSLAGMRQDIESELQEKIEERQTLSETLGGGDSPTAKTEIGMLTREVTMIQQQLAQAKDTLLALEINKTLAIQQARSITTMEKNVQEVLADDPTLANLQQDQYGISQRIRDLQSISKRGSSPEIKRLQERLQQLDRESQQYRIAAEEELRNQFKSAPNDSLTLAMAEYKLRHKDITESIERLQASYDEKMENINLKSASSSRVAMLTMEIDRLQEVEQTLAFKIRSWDVEEETAYERIKEWQRATESQDNNRLERFGIAGIGGLAAFCAICYCVALVEFRRRRLNSPSNVEEGLGIRVLGVLPSLSSPKAMAPGSPIAAQLSESIDGVRATLMHDSTSRPRQVVLVTSPATMEGSTTVASHLALSLTRAGRRTLLVDGDLRAPSLHKLFGMPVDDGLSEVLRSEIEISDAIRPTNTEGLWLLTAGQCDMDAIHALATEQPQPIFEKLRSEFDFVVIDGAPVLSLSDTLSIGQHVDGAILTVLRDHSEIRRIYQASEALKSMGVRIIGSVVNGVTVKADRRVARLHLAAAKQPRKLSASVEG